MKKFNIIKVSIASLVLTLLSACTDHFDQLNTPNNLVTDEVVDIDLIFTRIQAYAFIRDQTGGVVNGTSKGGLYAGVTMSESGGAFNVDPQIDMWTWLYTNYARNLGSIIRLTQDDPELVNKYAIARIMRVWAFARATDIYGDIPYSESALPLDKVIYTPRYDTQQSIYEDFFNELREAEALLDPTKESFGSSDLLYGGDVAMWAKFANSLRLRLALRVRYADSQLAADQMSDLTVADLITINDESAYAMTSNDLIENANPNYRTLLLNGTATYKLLLSKTMIDLWQDTGDPRLNLYADTAQATFQSFGYRGRPLLGDCPQEQKNPYTNESVSRWPMHMYAPIWPMPVLTAAEVNFALSEAALYGIWGTPGDAQTFYQAGIEASLDWSLDWSNITSSQLSDLFAIYDPEMTGAEVDSYNSSHALTQTKINNFIASSPVVTLTGTTEQMLEMIINQKMLSYFPTMLHEASAEFKRTGYPRVLIGDDQGDLQGVPPRRYLYPVSEQDLNSESYSDAVQRIGGQDDVMTKNWWDANPSGPHPHPGIVETRDTPWIN
ncbi:MAG: SusD/RagB family nutrient-binding outer membrane lipoprotein [Cyclobacteriaceae bacterium]